MPSPKHKCAHLGCDKMIAAQSTHCRNHVPRTKDWITKQARSQAGKTLSAETRRKISKARSGKVETTCQNCQQAFLVKPSQLRNGEGKYCSSKCAYAARSGENSPFWNGGKTLLTCDQCGQQFESYESFHKGKRTFCSFSCKGIYQKSRQHTTNTNIEQAMRKALTDTKIRFVEQIALHNISVADFYLPDYNLAIFCDGDYWHSLPEKQKRDKRQTKSLESLGVTVLRFWGKQILNDIDSCLDSIAIAIQSPVERECRQLSLPISE